MLVFIFNYMILKLYNWVYSNMGIKASDSIQVSSNVTFLNTSMCYPIYANVYLSILKPFMNNYLVGEHVRINRKEKRIE